VPLIDEKDGQCNLQAIDIDDLAACFGRTLAWQPRSNARRSARCRHGERVDVDRISEYVARLVAG
jgi:hypothetical protein